MSHLLSDFDYLLPEELIAQTPVEPRDRSRLMVIHRKTQKITHHFFNELPDIIQKYFNRPLFIANNSKVLPARFYGKRPTGGKVEILLLRKIKENTWESMIQMTAKAVAGVEFQILGAVKNLNVKIIKGSNQSSEGLVWLEFDWDPILSGLGELPLPHYMNRDPSKNDDVTYQTVYSKSLGSVAAPTAGLHFTKELLDRLLKQGCDWKEVTLHVGMGTFRPIKVDDIRNHKMHEEYYEVSSETALSIQLAKSNQTPVIAVGTTSVRCVESFWREQKSDLMHSTDIFIRDYSQFQIIDALITNFHLPKSSLLVLVSAFGGRDLVMKAYQEAISNRYRFYSYGDAMLIF